MPLPWSRTAPRTDPRHAASALTDPRLMVRHLGLLAAATAALAVAAVGMRLAIELWLRPHTWTMPGWLGLPLLTVATVAAAAAPIMIIVSQLRRDPLPRCFALSPRYRPTWWPAGRAFLIPPTPWWAPLTLAYASLSAGAVPLASDGHGGLEANGLTWLCLLLIGQPAGIALAWTALRGPRVALRPDGLLVAGAAGARLIGWDTLDLTGVVGPRRRRLTIAVTGAAPVTLPLSWLWVDPDLLRRAIMHYADDPTHRSEIGTAAELRRLQQELTGTHPAATTTVVIPRQRTASEHAPAER